MIGFGPMAEATLNWSTILREGYRLSDGMASVKWAVTKNGTIVLSAELIWISKKEQTFQY